MGLDILPIAVFVAKVKLQDWPDLALLHDSVEALLDRKYRQPTLYTLPIHELKKGVKLGDTFG